MASFVIDGSFAVDASGRKMHIRCWGDGEPTVVLQGGDGEIDDFEDTQVVRSLASQGRVCLFDRAGRGASDPAPNVARGPDAVAGDLHALLEAAGVDLPVVLAGSSFGGDLSLTYAALHPDDVAGVITLDTPAPNADVTPVQFPEGVWSHPKNPEHIDVFGGFFPLAKKGLHFDAPLIVVTAADGESDGEDQSYWLRSSPKATQVELTGGHEIYADQPDRIVALILDLVEGRTPTPS
jgi:pimeloyl-ACP methyl ester carboxylesterase